MADFKKLQTVLAQCAAAKNLTPAQMGNAMVNIDRMAPSFGKSNQEFRILKFVEGVQVYDDVTPEQFAAFVAHKVEMVKNNAYLVE